MYLSKRHSPHTNTHVRSNVISYVKVCPHARIRSEAYSCLVQSETGFNMASDSCSNYALYAVFLESNCTVGKKLSHPLLLEKENKSCQASSRGLRNCNYTDVSN